MPDQWLARRGLRAFWPSFDAMVAEAELLSKRRRVVRGASRRTRTYGYNRTIRVITVTLDLVVPHLDAVVEDIGRSMGARRVLRGAWDLVRVHGSGEDGFNARMELEHAIEVGQPEHASDHLGVGHELEEAGALGRGLDG